MMKYFMGLVVVFINCDKASTAQNDTEAPFDDITTEEVDKVFYTESQQEIINPERGFYAYADFASDDTNSLTEAQVRQYRSQGISLIYTVYYMKDFRNKPLSDTYLQRIRNNMQALRSGGSKAILRFAYTSDESQKPWDAPWSITQQHIEQLRPIFQEYTDVICLLQAGFIGVWGEWYYTDNYIFKPAQNQYELRRKVLDALLEAMPKERMVCVRYPQAKLYSYNIQPTDSITQQTAYNGSDLSRIGFHNDCFLADSDDTGTFQNVAAYRTYWQRESKYVPMGGETCKLSTFSMCNNALLDMERYHWSYINRDYQKSVIQEWEKGQCLDQIKKKLGYRFVLTEGVFSKKAVVGKPFSINLKIKNIGWAAPFNPRDVEVVFVGNNDTLKIKLTDDPRHWFAGENITLRARFNLPENIQEGSYDVYLNLPDPYKTIANRPEFSIRLANEGIWNDSLGYNKLHSIVVTKE